MPVRKRTRTTASPRIPIVTSLIGAPYHLKDVRDEDEALNKTADADSKSYGVKGQLQREGDLSCSIKIHPHFDEVPPEQGEKPDSKASRDNVDDVPYLLSET